MSDGPGLVGLEWQQHAVHDANLRMKRSRPVPRQSFSFADLSRKHSLAAACRPITEELAFAFDPGGILSRTAGESSSRSISRRHFKKPGKPGRQSHEVRALSRARTSACFCQLQLSVNRFGMSRSEVMTCEGAGLDCVVRSRRRASMPTESAPSRSLHGSLPTCSA